ncbi:ATP-binding protein, partial [Methanococcus maripaludis]
RIEEPRIEEPRIEEPRIEEPRIEEPRIEEPRIKEPIGIINQTKNPEITDEDIEKPLNPDFTTGFTQTYNGINIILGTKSGENHIWYPNNTKKLMHPNTGIIGTMGTGKTQFTKSLVTQLNLNSKYNVNKNKIDILIFDYKGEYIKDDFVNANNAKVYDLHHLPFNPLSLVKSGDSVHNLPLNTATTIVDSIVTSFKLGQVQEITLKDILMEAYAEKGIMKNDEDTWDYLAPTFEDVYGVYLNQENVKRDKLYAALNKIVDHELFEPNIEKTTSLYDLIDGVTVINLSRYEQSIQNLIVAITLDVFYSQMQKHGHSQIDGDYRELTKIILVDEADNFLSQNFQAIRRILKEGREYGVGVILSTQFLNHFVTGENRYSDYILTWVVHNVTELTPKEIKTIFNTTTKSEEDELFNKIKSMQKHYSLIKSGTDNPVYIRDLPFYELNERIISNLDNDPTSE